LARRLSARWLNGVRLPPAASRTSRRLSHLHLHLPRRLVQGETSDGLTAARARCAGQPHAHHQPTPRFSRGATTTGNAFLPLPSAKREMQLASSSRLVRSLLVLQPLPLRILQSHPRTTNCSHLSRPPIRTSLTPGRRFACIHGHAADDLCEVLLSNLDIPVLACKSPRNPCRSAVKPAPL
jgi:hypothetical protein